MITESFMERIEAQYGLIRRQKQIEVKIEKQNPYNVKGDTTVRLDIIRM